MRDYIKAQDKKELQEMLSFLKSLKNDKDWSQKLDGENISALLRC